MYRNNTVSHRNQYNTPHPRNSNSHAKYQRRPRQRINAPSIYVSINIREFIHLEPLATQKFKAYITLDKLSPHQSSPDLVYTTQLTRYMGIKLKTFTCCLNKDRDNIAEVTLTNTRKDMSFNFPDLVLNNIMAIPKTRINKLDSKYSSDSQPSSSNNEPAANVSSSQTPSSSPRKTDTPYSPSKVQMDSPPYSPSVKYSPTRINDFSPSEPDPSNNLLDFPELDSLIQQNSPLISSPLPPTQHSNFDMPVIEDENELKTPSPSLFPSFET